ncbi:MAG: ABC transporter substrate binding protein [Bacteroidales bacterium]|nr:ABC transporter substrate binding protein [Bacteroidales bacterium]
MQQLKYYIFITFLLIVNHHFSFSQNNSDTLIVSQDYVLILNFHLESAQWEGNVEDEVTKFLNSTHLSNVFAEHIKAIDITTPELLKQEQDRILKKYLNRPRAVIFVGPAALPMFAECLNRHWPDVPIINSIAQKYTIPLEKYFQETPLEYDDNLSPITEEDIKKKYNITGIFAHNSLKEIVELMLLVLPDMNHLVFISDERIGSIIVRQRLKSIIAKDYPNLSMEFITAGEYSLNDMFSRVASFDFKTGIFYHSWSVKGKDADSYFIWNNMYKNIGQASKVPVFVSWDMNTAKGYIAGGVFNRMIDLSNKTIEVLKQVLAGTNPRDIPYQTIDKEKRYLNYSNLASYHSSKIKFPKDVYYFSKPENALYTYRYELFFIFIVIVFIILYCVQRIHFLNKAKEKQKKELDYQKELQHQIGLRNFKLALSLEVSTINPWVWNLSNKSIYFDDVKQIMENPNNPTNLLMYSEEDFLSWIYSEDKDRMMNIFYNLRNGKSNYLKEECRLLMPQRDEKYSWYMIQAVTYEKDYLGKPITLVGTMTLITETKELELELIKARDAAQESDRLKSKFLANLSHEIRTPLNAIVGFSGVLANSEDIEERKELADIVKHNNKLLLSLINDILEISKIESGAAEFNFSAFEVNAVLNDLKDSFLEEVDKKVSINLDMPLNELFIYSEKTKIRQVLNRLMSNAAKFTREGSITIGYYKPVNDVIRFFIKDTGCGIPEEQLQTVFGRFVKLNTFEQGTGLGLSVAQLIVEKLNGQIGVFSEFRNGSEFWFEIPYNESNRQAVLIGDNSKHNHIDRNLPDIKILVAEDSQSNYAILCSMMDPNCQLLHAWNGKEAVEMFSSFKPDLVLMDIKMPKMDGYSAVAEIRKLSTTVPIVAMSAYAFDDDRERLIQKGFDEYEPKPIDKNKLSNILNKIYKNKKMA